MDKHFSFEARFDYGAKQPDEFCSKLGAAPKDSFIVAYDREGQPISRYGDDVWDMSAYQKNKSIMKLNFISWVGRNPTGEHITITTEIKWLLFLYWYFWETTNSVNTLVGTLSSLRNMAKYCAEHAISPIKLLKDPIKFSVYLDQIIGSQAKNFSALITALIDMGEAKRGFPLLLGASLEELCKIARVENTRNKQHPVIPTRIYSTLISHAIDEFTSFEIIADPFLQLINDCAQDPKLGRCRYKKNKNIKQKLVRTVNGHDNTCLPSFSEFLDQYGLCDYVEEFSQRTGKNLNSIKTLAAHLKKKQSICFLLITLFSGMRRGETNRLPYNCLETYYENGKKHYRLCGETFKFANGLSVRTKWVTDQIVVQAIHVAQKIADMTYSIIGKSLNSEQRTNSDYPLFIGLGYLPFAGKSDRMTKKAPYTNSKGLGTKETLPENLFLTITEEDIQELESIDPFRDWRSEKRFTIGLRWSYSPHQARRSLAVYAAASGFVSLPSLRRQLQHITEEMTVYYAKGSAYAKNLVADEKDHFYHDYQAAQPEAQALAYIAQILLSDEPLFGGHGAWIAQRFNQQETLSVEDRKTTMQRFKKGELAYKITPLGGCTTVEPCDKQPMRTVTACLDCAKAVIKDSNINKVIKKTEAQLSRIDPQSKEHELKENDLSVLIAFKDLINAKTGKK